MEKISKLTPILYEKNEENYNHNGLGKLTGLLVNEIEEVLNGQFEALFEYPANGRLANKIDNKMLIKAKPNRKDEPHVFRVYDYVLDTVSQTYLIYARSKNIDDLGGNMILDVNVRNQTPNQAWNTAKNNALEPVNITFSSDITTTSSVHWERRNLLSVVAGEEGSMVQYWGGETKHGNGWLWLYRRRGQDNVTTVRHGKNLEGLTATYSTKGLVTAIVPYYIKRGDADTEPVSLYGNVVQSQYVNNYPHVYYDTVEYTDDDLGLDRDNEPEDGWSDSAILNALNNVADRYFIEHTGIDLPSINMEINLEDISQTKEYEHFKDFEQIEIGDTITVYSKKFDVNVTAKVRRVVYNGLTDKNETVEVGTVSRSVYDDYKDLVNNRVDKKANELQEGIDHAQASANGKNTNYYGTADPNEAGLIGQEKDTYFRTNGQEKELWIFRDGMWHVEIDDMTGERIKADVAIAQAEAENARQQADATHAEVSQSVQNAGFTSMDDMVTDQYGRISNAEHLITGIQTTVAEKVDFNVFQGSFSELEWGIQNADSNIDDLEQELSTVQSQWTQTFDAFQQTVSTETGLLNTAISQNLTAINARVEKGDVVNQINIGGESILIDADKIHLGTSTTIDDGIITNRMVATDISADKLTTGTLNAANVRIINLDFDTAVGNRTEFITSAWNNALGGQVTIEGNHINVLDPTGEFAQLRNGGIFFYDTQGNNVGSIETTYQSTSGTGVGIHLRNTNNFEIKRWIPGGENSRLLRMTSDGSTEFFADIKSNQISSRNNADLELGSLRNSVFQNQLSFHTDGIRVNASINMRDKAINFLESIRSPGNLDVYSNNTIALRFGTNQIRTYRTLDMNGNQIINSPSVSDERLKDVHGLRDVSDLGKLLQIEYVNYTMKDTGMEEFGFIAQQVQSIAPEIMMDVTGGYLGYNNQQYTHLIGHAVQQLALREINTNLLASKAYLKAETNEEKIARLEDEIEHLKEQIA